MNYHDQELKCCYNYSFHDEEKDIDNIQIFGICDMCKKDQIVSIVNELEDL